jgi:membrane-associated phospholipid phosphatase
MRPRPEELFLAGFAGLLVALGAIYRQPLQLELFWAFPVVALLFAGLVGLRASLDRRPVGPAAARALRAFLPLFLAFGAFNALRLLTAELCPRLADDRLIAIDRWLLGTDAGLVAERFAHPVLTRVMGWAYAAQLAVLPLLMLVFYLQGRPAQSQRVALALLVICALGIAGYFLVPTVGPYVYQAKLFRGRLPGASASDPVMTFIDGARGVARDCFPSLHVGYVVISALFLGQMNRWAFIAYLPFAALVVLSTIYLRVHYVIDLIAGVPVGWAAVALAERLQRRWGVT